MQRVYMRGFLSSAIIVCLHSLAYNIYVYVKTLMYLYIQIDLLSKLWQ